MKKIVYLISFILISFLAKGQYPVNQSLGSDSTMILVKGGIKGRMVINNFTDTTQANTQRIKNYSGGLIYTLSDSSLWVRNVGSTKWSRIYTSGGSLTTPDLQSVTDVNNQTTNNLIVSSGFGSKTRQSSSSFEIEQTSTGKSIVINTTTLTDNRIAALQNASGTIAYLSNISDSSWGLAGNTIIAGKYLGTNNVQDLVLKTNSNAIATFSGDGLYRVKMGSNTTASGNYSTAMGGTTTASGDVSTAMGNGAIASGSNSTAMGSSTTASGNNSTAMGNITVASGTASTAMGNGTAASGTASTAMGISTTASGSNSTAMGESTKSKSYSGTVIGTFNDSTNATSTTSYNALNRAFQVGIGTANNARSNAITVLFNGKTGIGTTTPDSLLTVEQGLLAKRGVRFSSLPTGVGTKALRIDASGNLSVADTTGGTVTSVSGTEPVQVATGTTTPVISMKKASATDSGWVSIGTQTFEGAKTFNKDLTVNTITVGRGLGNIATNTAIGLDALKVNTTADYNTAIGWKSLTATTIGKWNTAVGAESLISNISGESNSAFGLGTLYHNSSGSYNAAYGTNAMLENTTGNHNTGIGTQVFRANLSGSNNIGIGYFAGQNNTTASNQLFINSLDRTNYAGDTTKSIIYGVQDATAANQRLYLNSKIIMPYLPTGVGTKALRIDASGNVSVADTTSTSAGAALFPTSGTGTALSSVTGDLNSNNLIASRIKVLSLTAANTTSLSSANKYANLSMDSVGTAELNGRGSTIASGGGIAGLHAMDSTTGGETYIRAYGDSVWIAPYGGNLTIDSLNASSNATDSMMVWNKANGHVGYRAILAGNAGTVTSVSGTAPIVVVNGTTTPVISMKKASATDSGWVSTGTQTMAGAKTFTSDATVNTIKVGLGGGNIATNTALGVSSLSANTTGFSNTAVGYEALKNSIDANANQNTAVGYQSQLADSSGYGNTSVGSYSSRLNKVGVGITAIGYGALSANLGNNNTALGAGALEINTTGQSNIAIGFGSLHENLSGNSNVGIGQTSLYYTTANNNIGLGDFSGYYNTSNSSQLFINSLNRSDYLGDTTKSIIYGVQNSTAASQRLYLNSGVYMPYLPTTGTVSKSLRITSTGQVIATDTLASTGGTVTSVSGTANQIAVATGTTTPVISLVSGGTLPGAWALGTPASGTVTNLTGTASININGTVGATTATTGAFTTATASTSLTTPLLIGGTTTTSPLTFKTTTGVGATGARHIFQVGNNGATEAMTILNSANVGIGTATPDSMLTVQQGLFAKRGVRLSGLPTGVGTKALRINATGQLSMADTTTVPLPELNATNIGFGNSNNKLGGSPYFTYDANTYKFQTNGNNMGENTFTFDGSNNKSYFNHDENFNHKVGINTTTPTVALDVVGDVNLGTGYYTDGFISYYEAAKVAYIGDRNYDNNGIVIKVDDDNQQILLQGAVQMNNYGAGAATFDASGNISSFSDERLKTNIKSYKTGLKELLQLKPIQYKWNEKSKMETEGTYAGFSAQNVKANIPLGTGENKEGYLSLQDRAIMATLVNAVKELNTKIENLEKQNAKLVKKLNKKPKKVIVKY